MPATQELYFDHNATSPLLPEVIEAMSQVLDRAPVNPASAHQAGLRSRSLLRAARDQLATLLAVDSREILFTSGGSEANQLALFGLLEPDRPCHVVSSAIEHSSILEGLDLLRELGHTTTLVSPGKDGRVDPEHVRQALRADTRLVALMAANNETGVLQPVDEVALLLQDTGIPLHIDAVQTLGKSSPPQLGEAVVSMAVSAHKIGGPAGSGALWLRAGKKLRPLLRGGTQERGLRGGTHNLLGIVGFGAAAGVAADQSPWSPLVRDHFEEQVFDHLQQVTRNGDAGQRLPNTSNLCFDGVDGDRLVQSLTLRGLHTSQGSACQAGATRPSHVLLAMGLSLEQTRSSVRFSFGHRTTEAEIQEGVGRLVEEVQRLRSAGDAA